MSITAEESRALLEQIFDVDIVPTSLLRDHLRAALDREAELQVERDAAVEWAEKADAERDAARTFAKRAEADKFKMRDERDKAKIMANNYGNFVHEARKRAEKAEAERDAAKAEIKAMQESGSWFQEKDINRLQSQVEAAEKMAEALRSELNARHKAMQFRTADFHSASCTCLRCAEDRTEAALAAWDASKEPGE